MLGVCDKLKCKFNKFKMYIYYEKTFRLHLKVLCKTVMVCIYTILFKSCFSVVCVQ